jgi:hypothetical protein
MKTRYLALLLAAAPAFAQHEHMNMPMPAEKPADKPPSWNLMLHGTAFAGGDLQSGPRGADQLFTANWLMAMADKKTGPGTLSLRAMFSLEPLFLGKRGYAELFQTGEGLLDRQHPHDFVMELAARYDLDLGDGTSGYVYAAPVGSPALGPIAFPHRASAQELPQAPLAHHLQDSTHIASSVVTLGARRGAFGAAFSGFHGEEPDQNRWDIDRGGIDSWSAQALWYPLPQWSAQLSTGHLRHPERDEPGDQQRTTASVTFEGSDRAASVIAGTNGHQSSVGVEGWFRNFTGRFEIVEKEVFGDRAVKALTVGYRRGIFGGNVTVYGVPSELRASYGRTPVSVYAFVKLQQSMHR